MRSKRLFDLVLTLPGLFILAPFFVVVAIWLKCDTPGSVYYKQQRVGLKGKLFMIYKFRTMVTDADQKGLSLTVGDDPRVTRVGKILRKYKIDEFPQLFNVIRGEMSLVGPRPEVLKFVDLYTEQQRAVLDLVPGVTDLASLKYNSESTLLAALVEETNNGPEYIYINQIMPDKIRINLEYAAKANMWTDFIVILRTVFKMRIIYVSEDNKMPVRAKVDLG